MKIISWNCNGAFRRKFNQLDNADVYVIQECENPAESNDQSYEDWAVNYLWIGDSKNKGLGIFTRSDIRLERLDWSDEFDGHKVKHFLPCRVNDQFQLLAVWTHRNKSPKFEYIGQLWKYLQINKEKFNDILIIGDFNSNVIWDKRNRWWNHTDVVNELREYDIESMYHRFFDETQGNEITPTLYLQKNIGKPYHIDYAFGSDNFLSALDRFEIGGSDQWLASSDHMPIICEFNINL